MRGTDMPSKSRAVTLGASSLLVLFPLLQPAKALRCLAFTGRSIKMMVTSPHSQALVWMLKLGMRTNWARTMGFNPRRGCSEKKRELARAAGESGERSQAPTIPECSMGSEGKDRVGIGATQEARLQSRDTERGAKLGETVGTSCSKLLSGLI